jgi:hypothetical protein
MWQHLHLKIVDGMVASLCFSLLSPLSFVSYFDPIVIHKGSSAMILRLGVGRMGLCLVCLGRCNPRERESVLVKDCKSRRR